MIDLTAQFLNLIEQENACLHALQTRSFQNFQTSKNAYLTDYRRLSELLQQEVQSGVPDSEKWKRLHSLSKLFWSAIQENYRL
ncbi:MAG: hypothetical protein LBH38_03710 [Holosporales bacterium]|jgi:hypothetical protein|nr:hypothetical protein [Holosporales bacterium]